MRNYCISFMVLMVLGACSGRLSDVGHEPTFTPIGHNNEFRSPVDARLLAKLPPKATTSGNTYAQGSLWNSGPSSLFGDRRARGLGDILTVVIEIKDEAKINNSSNRARSASDDFSMPNFLGVPELINDVLPGDATLEAGVGVSSNSSATGNGSIARNEEITLRVAATVLDILPNGHLVVQGNQEVRVNYELRDLQVAGIVRPEDISRKNEITYDKIAGARISYGGRGQVSDMQQPRYGQQIADRILPY